MKETDTLARKLREYACAYYNGNPIITDDEFDQLRDQLETIDPDHTFLSEIGAPNTISGWPEHKHRNLMGSLLKVNNKEDFMDWAKDKGDEFYLSEKYDGSTVVATYENGQLMCLATRGDGQVGENITQNNDQILGAPPSLMHIPDGPNRFSGEIRGEAMILLDSFEKHFRPIEGRYKNPRNTANGKVRDMKEDPLKQHVEVFWFDILPFDFDIKTESDKWKLLENMGMNCDGYDNIRTAEGIWTIFEKYRDGVRMAMNYEIDGLVVKVNDVDAQESFGMRSGRPKGAIAIKFPAVRKHSVVKDIVWQRGLTGAFCPVAVLEPVDIQGVTVTRASLCGIEEIQRLDIAIGDSVVVSRRNDVIPKIEEVLKRKPGRPTAQAPKTCNICNEELFRDGAYLLCVNTECQGEIFGNLMTWLKTLRIKGFGPSIVRALIEEDVTNPAELYEARVDVLSKATNSEVLGPRRYTTLHASKKVRLSTFLSALNIKALGNTNGQRLEKKFETLDGVLAATEVDLQGVPGIKTNAKKIHKGLRTNAKLIGHLRGLLTISDLDTSGPLAGISVCITGDLKIPRPKVQDWIKEKGGEVKSGISKTLTYLVTNSPESGTSKNKKADKYGVEKITEMALYALVGEEPK